jgi:predicted NBD/HSP70 family sugar kinase
MNHNAIWGIDLGGTKVEGVVLDQHEPGRVICRQRIPTEADQGYEHILQQIKKLIGILEEASGLRPRAVGIGTPGTTDPASGHLKNSNTICLNHQPFKADMEHLLGIPVALANDANCFALAEASLGIVPETTPRFESVFGVIMGTGCGGGIVVRDTDGSARVLNGRHGIAGEWGHNFLDESGGSCYCGRIGCVEKIISGTGLQNYYHSITGETLSLREIMKLYQQGSHAAAEATVQRLLSMFGKAIANVINILDPDVIVLGGGVGNIDLLYTEGRQHIKQYIFNPSFETPLLRPRLGDSAGVFGAAMLVAGPPRSSKS